jgi:hypothetical protein
MPDTSAAEADALARHLTTMVGQMRHHAKDGRVHITLRHASANADQAPDVLLAQLGRELALQADAKSTTAAGA